MQGCTEHAGATNGRDVPLTPDASLSEHFYQLRAVPEPPMPTTRLARHSPPRRNLTRRQRWGLLVFLVGCVSQMIPSEYRPG